MLPPSTETSTPPTTPPLSVAVPVTVTAVFAATLLPADGDVMVDTGGVVSVDAVAGSRPGCSVVGCAFMSARMFTVACCMFASGAALPRSWFESRPHDHWMVPAPNTRAPLAAL